MSSGPTCPKCGRINRPGVKFCATCGTSLSAVPPQPTTPIQSPQPTPRPVSPQSPPRPTPVAQPAARRGVSIQPLYLAIAAAAAIGVLLCVALVILFGSNLGFGSVSPTATIVAFLPPTALQTLTQLPTQTPIPASATPLKETVVVTAVVVVTATPVPTDTHTPVPPSDTPTPLPSPTQTPLPSKTHTPKPQSPPPPPATTMPGSQLLPGQFWVSDGMMMFVGAPRITAPCDEIMVEFPFTIQNTQPTELRLSLDGTQFILTDSKGEAKELYYVLGPNPQPCEAYKKLGEFNLNGLPPNQKIDLFIHARGKLPSDVTGFKFMVVRVGKVENAKWNLPIVP